MPNDFNTEEQWRERAEEARTHAEAMRTAEARHTMFKIAEAYERLAKQATAWVAKEKSPD